MHMPFDGNKLYDVRKWNFKYSAKNQIISILLIIDNTSSFNRSTLMNRIPTILSQAHRLNRSCAVLSKSKLTYVPRLRSHINAGQLTLARIMLFWNRTKHKCKSLAPNKLGILYLPTNIRIQHSLVRYSTFGWRFFYVGKKKTNECFIYMYITFFKAVIIIVIFCF